MHKIRNIILALILLTATFAPVIKTPVMVASADSPIEITAERTANSKTYDLGGRTRQVEVAMGDIHYKNDYSNDKEPWKDIDLTVKNGYLGTAPYELWIDGNKYTMRDKRTGEVSTIELLTSSSKNFEVKIENTKVSFTHTIDARELPYVATFKVNGRGFSIKASDDIGGIQVDTSFDNPADKVMDWSEVTNKNFTQIDRDEIGWLEGIITESIINIKDTDTGFIRLASGKIKVDPTWQVVTGTDDCYKVAALFDVNSLDFRAGDILIGTNPAGSAARFVGINIPAGATINTATLKLTASGNFASDNVNTYIRAEANNTPTTFDNVTEFDARVWTTANVTWDAIAHWTTDTEYTSPDFKDVIQEVVDRPGWTAGNPIAIKWDDFGGRSDASASRSAYSYDGSATKAPKLLITFTGSLTDAYWVGGTGTWSDDDNHWAPVSGGIPGDGNLPASTTNVHFDANSFTGAGQTVTIGAAAYCKDMDWTGATNSPTLAFAAESLIAYGNVTLITNMSLTRSGATYTFQFRSGGNSELTTAGKDLFSILVRDNNTHLKLMDNLVLSSTLTSMAFGSSGSPTILTTNNFNITASGAILGGYANAKTWNLGSSIISCEGFSTNALDTMNAGTSTINVSGTGVFTGATHTYNIINLIGTSHTVSGTFTCVNLTYDRSTAGVQTITQTAGQSIIVTGTFTATGDSATDRCTMQSSVAGSLWQIRAGTIVETNTTKSNYILADVGGEVNINCAGATGGTFAGGSNTFTDANIAGAGSYPLTITGNNIYSGDFDVDASVATKQIIATGTTQTVGDFTRDTGTNIITITGGNWTQSPSVPPLKLSYLTVANSQANPSGTWYAVNSTDGGGGNTGWIFDSPCYAVLYIDGSEADITYVPYTTPIPDTDFDYTFGSDATPYINTMKITKDGVITGSWAWVYGENFTDLSGYGNTGLPSFRIASSDADVSAELISFQPVAESAVDNVTATTWPTLYTTPPSAPTNTYSENSTPGLFFRPLVATMARAGEWSGASAATLESLFWYMFAFGIIIPAGVLVYYMFASRNLQALFIKVVVMAGLMIFFSLPGLNIFGFIIPFYFILFSFGILVLSKDYGW